MKRRNKDRDREIVTWYLAGKYELTWTFVGIEKAYDHVTKRI